MKLPRRVPWTSISELDQVCTWIFAEESDFASKTRAVNRLSAWRAITALPHALESTLALLSVMLQDNSPGSSSSSSCLSLRQSYANCIIRLVNGLVDPLQLGAYARSIASIAMQLGLPLWLVELRHAATHEDLPSLELLRGAASESMKWLLHNYFLPTLNPSTTPRLEATLRPLGPILTRYKKLLKLTTRDASLHTHFGAAINSLLRDVERWVAEAKVAASVEGFGWGGGGTTVENGEYDMKEKWALDKLCDALLENGVLVPVSKKKRVYPADSFLPPEFSVLLWSPLLTHIQSHHPDLRSALAHRIVTRLLPDTTQLLDVPIGHNPMALEPTPPDPSFDACLSHWAWWIVNAWAVDPPDSDYDLRRDIIATLFTMLGPSAGRPASAKINKAAHDLLHALCKADPDLEAALALLFPTAGNALSSLWGPDDMDVMDDRLNALLPQDCYMQPQDADAVPQPLFPTVSQDHSLPQAPGWRLLDNNSQWRPCPIGVYVGGDVVHTGPMPT